MIFQCRLRQWFVHMTLYSYCQYLVSFLHWPWTRLSPESKSRSAWIVALISASGGLQKTTHPQSKRDRVARNHGNSRPWSAFSFSLPPPRTAGFEALPVSGTSRFFGTLAQGTAFRQPQGHAANENFKKCL
jgi:hypothetical protein